jgi:hypothetical protein
VQRKYSLDYFGSMWSDETRLYVHDSVPYNIDINK